MDLTPTKERTFRFIRNYIGDHGYSPSLSEIAEGLGIKSRGSVHRYVRELADAGYIEFTEGTQRNIQLKNGYAPDEIPFLGRIAAGKPIEAIEDLQIINVTEELAGEERYALQVKGDSMIDAGILDGDIVIIRKANRASNGDIVVALVDDNEATLKRLKVTTKNKVELIPENSTMKPMVYRRSQIKIQGVLVGQFRTY